MQLIFNLAGEADYRWGQGKALLQPDAQPSPDHWLQHAQEASGPGRELHRQHTKKVIHKETYDGRYHLSQAF